jgi:voltage-gated potassium channel
MSFFGFIDLLAIVPTYASVIFVGSQSFAVIRVVRLLRVFRVLKLVQFLGEADRLKEALRASGHKVFVFLLAVSTLVISIGAVMYYVEGEDSGFTSIPESVYWAIVTMTTVGYGDITPQTVLGKFLSALVMIVGYAIIAVPTGIVTAELVHSVRGEMSTQACQACLAEGHRVDAVFCRRCGNRLNEEFHV